MFIEIFTEREGVVFIVFSPGSLSVLLSSVTGDTISYLKCFGVTKFSEVWLGDSVFEASEELQTSSTFSMVGAGAVPAWLFDSRFGCPDAAPGGSFLGWTADFDLTSWDSGGIKGGSTVNFSFKCLLRIARIIRPGNSSTSSVTVVSGLAFIMISSSAADQKVC